MTNRVRATIGALVLLVIVLIGVTWTALNRQNPSPPPASTATAAVPADRVRNVAGFGRDDFSNPGSGWPTVELDNGRYGYHPPDFYHLEVNHNNDQLTVFRGLSLTDFTAETNALVDHTDTERGDFRYGLALRRSDDNYYAFTVAPRSRKWQALKHSSDGFEVLAEGAVDLQGLVAVDTLRVDASGSTFIYSINGQPVTQVNDADYASGDLGFFAETFDETLAHVHYDSLDVRQVSIDAAGLTAVSTEAALPSSAGMVKINGGAYKVGLDTSGDEYIPPQQIEITPFWIDQYEVTNAGYAAFIAASGAEPPEGWPNGELPTGLEHHPVEGVTWDQAEAFCLWTQKRLPTEAEWEIAARGSVGSLYPWGDDLNAIKLPRGGTYPVGSIAENRSPFDVFDMAGNVWEWVAEPYQPLQTGERVLRGGGHGFLKDMAYRLQGDPTIPTMYATAGIRCAADQVNLVLAANIIYQDDFVDPTSGWPTQDLPTGRYGYHPPDFYHVEVAQPAEKLVIFHELSLTDYTVETQVLIDHTADETGAFRYGLAVGESQQNYYAFTISPRSQSWQILKSGADAPQTLAEGPVEGLRGAIALDKLRVDVTGSSYNFSINDETIASIDDAGYTPSDVGFFVENFDEPLAHIHYDTFQVRQAEPPQADDRLVQDDFTDPHSGWPTVDLDNGRYGYHPPDFYHLEAAAANEVVTAFRGVDFDNYTAQTTVLVDHTESEGGNFRYGLALRGSDQGYYGFAISPRSQSWQIIKRAGAQTDVLAEGEAGALRGMIALDTLRVDVSDSDFVFSINNEPIAGVSDATYQAGDVGFFLETLDEPLAHVHFDSVDVRRLDPEAIAALAEAVSAAEPIAAQSETAPPPIEAPAGMASIAPGYFQMGSALGEADEKPEHPALLNGFFIDLNEVTNRQYRDCVAVGGCTQAGAADSLTYSGYRDDPAYDNYPVVNVSWDQAATYCRWSGKRLPTEAEWEYAAGGPDNFIWAWGSTFDPNLSAAAAADTQPVGSYSAGVSPFGLFDMTGNAAEWVADVYDPGFYASSPVGNPINLSENDARVYRGGSVGDPNGSLSTTSRRFGKLRTFSDPTVGFRCALAAPEANAAPSADLTATFCQVYQTYKPDAACP